MSQVIFKTTWRDQEVEVMSGYDPPIDAYFLTIFDKDDEVLWSGLDHFDFPGMTTDLNLIKETLEYLGIKPPDGFFETIKMHEGNVIRRL